MDREKVIAWLADEELYYRDHGDTHNSLMACNALDLLKEQDNEKKRIMKVIWDTLHEGLSIDTVVDQDWVYEQIRHKIEDT